MIEATYTILYSDGMNGIIYNTERTKPRAIIAIQAALDDAGFEFNSFSNPNNYVCVLKNNVRVTLTCTYNIEII